MIKLKVGNAGHETDIRFPISESDLYDRLFEILAIDSPDQQPPVTVKGIYWPEEFSVLEGRQVNLDEMNYLAKRMESFDALEKLSSENMDWEKLAAVAELADARKASQIAALAERLEDFAFIPKVSDEEDIAHYLVDNVDGYGMHPDMEDFFDFSAFGEQFAEEHGGQFVNGGFAYYSGYGSMDELLEDLTSEDEGMTMGGM